VLTLMVATRGMRASERKRPMKSWRTVSYTGSVTRYKDVMIGIGSAGDRRPYAEQVGL
jgi:hypothetical protein